VLLMCMAAPALLAANAEGPVYHHHSIGSAGFLAATNGDTFRAVWQLPNSVELLKQVERQSAGVALAAFVPASRLSNAVVRATPLAHDLVEQETIVDVRGAPGSLQWSIALRLPQARQNAWNEALRGILADAGIQPVAPSTQEGFTGARGSLAKGQVQWVSAGDWFVLSFGPGVSTESTAWLQAIRKSGTPEPALGDHWLTVQADLGRLSKTFTLIPDFAASQVDLSFGPRGKNVRTDAKLEFPNSLDWIAEPWVLPLESIHDPIVGFSAARGIRPLLSKNADLMSLQLPMLPNQACSWSMASIPYIVSAACPMPNSSNTIWQGLQGLPTLLTNYGRPVGQMTWITNSGQLVWQGLPFIGPTAKPLFDGGVEFLHTSILPPPAAGRKPPAALFSFMSRTNLAYYDWEITEERVNAWRYIYQVGLLVFGRVGPDTNAPTQRLMDDLSSGKRLANCVTEVTVTGPSELTVVRNSPVGLTGLEIVNFLRWVDTPHFPFTYDPAPQLDLKRLAMEQRARRATNNVGNRPKLPAPGVAPPSTPRPWPPRPNPATNNPAVRRSQANGLPSVPKPVSTTKPPPSDSNGAPPSPGGQ
jgi:hypothetical protein